MRCLYFNLEYGVFILTFNAVSLFPAGSSSANVRLIHNYQLFLGSEGRKASSGQEHRGGRTFWDFADESGGLKG